MNWEMFWVTVIALVAITWGSVFFWLMERGRNWERKFEEETRAKTEAWEKLPNADRLWFIEHGWDGFNFVEIK